MLQSLPIFPPGSMPLKVTSELEIAILNFLSQSLNTVQPIMNCADLEKNVDRGGNCLLTLGDLISADHLLTFLQTEKRSARKL